MCSFFPRIGYSDAKLYRTDYYALHNTEIFEKQSEEKYLQLTDRMSTLDGLWMCLRLSHSLEKEVGLIHTFRFLRSRN
mgnify:CR=1 FL=1